jgi:hypothetical protein
VTLVLSLKVEKVDSMVILSVALGHRSDLQLSVVVSVVDGGVPGRRRPVGAERFGKCSPQATVLCLELTDVLVSGNEPGPERWVRGALALGDNRAKRGALPSSEPVDLSTQVGCRAKTVTLLTVLVVLRQELHCGEEHRASETGIRVGQAFCTGKVAGDMSPRPERGLRPAE